MTGRLITYLKVHKGKSLLAILLACGTVLAGMGLMGFSGHLISRAAERPMLVDLFMITAAVRFFGISRAVVRYFERLVSHDLTFRILLHIRTSFYRQLNRFSHKWMMSKKPGELLTAMISDIESLQNAYLRIIAPVIVSFLICCITFVLLLLFDGWLAFAVLLFFLLNGLLVPFLALKRARGGGVKERRARGKMKGFLVEKIQGMHDALWLEGRERLIHQMETIQEQLDEVQRHHANSSGMVEGLNQLLANLAALVALLLIIPLVLGGQIQATMLAALVLGVLSSFEALQALSSAFVHYDGFRASANSLHQLTKAGEPPAGPKQPAVKPLGDHPHLAFRQVSFSYDKTRQTLRDVSFELPPGSRTAILGPTGSGKTTLLNLLTGLWPAGSGQVCADGHSIDELDMTSYRELLAVLSQDTFIFNRTVRENLLMARPGASDGELEDALNEVGLSFLAGKLDWSVGSQGMKLSGGERQLFAMARALLKRSRIWLFDELSANMDVATERKILDTLWSKLHDRTLVMISHRLVDMDRMDHILVLREGKVAERGSHQTLLESNGHYARMLQHQMQLIKDKV